MTDASDEPLVSVVLPTYDRSDLAVGAAESVFEQTHGPIELLVVDDCSPDPIAPALSGLDPGSERSVHCIRHGQNRGASAARNTGIEAASGAYLAFLDDDDRWHPEKLERQLTALAASEGAFDEEIGVVHTGQRVVVDGETTSVVRPTVRGVATRELLCGATLGTFSTLLVRADVAERAGPLDESFPCWQDREWPLRLSRHCAFEAVPEPLVVRQVGEHEQLSDDFAAKRDVAHPMLVERFHPVAAELGCERTFLAAQYRAVAAAGLRAGSFGDARRFAFRAIRAEPTDLESYLYLLVSLGGRPTLELARTIKRAASKRA